MAKIEVIYNLLSQIFEKAVLAREVARKENDADKFKLASKYYKEAAVSHNDFLKSHDKLNNLTKISLQAFEQYILSNLYECELASQYASKIENPKKELETCQRSKFHILIAIKILKNIDGNLNSNNQKLIDKDLNRYTNQKYIAEIDELSIKTKIKINAENYIDAFDLNTINIKKQKEFVSFLEKQENTQSLRVQKGNLYNKLFRHSQILFGIDLKEYSNVFGIHLYDLIDRLIESYDYLLEAEKINPENKQQYLNVREEIVRRINLQLTNNKNNWSDILLKYDKTHTLIPNIMKNNDLDSYIRAKAKTELENNKNKILIIRGIFWFGFFILLYFILSDLASNKGIDLVRFLGVLFGLPIIFTIIGAFILRSTDSLSQVNFIQLIKLTLNINLKGISALNPKKNKT